MLDLSVSMGTTIQQRIEDSITVRRALVAQVSLISDVAAVMIEAYRKGNKALLFGNGGSAADAQHIATEFVGRFYLERRALPALALAEHTSTITAIGNDYGFDRVFARQLEAFAAPGDIAVGMSTSGNSPNVVEGLRTARGMGMTTVALTGAGGGLVRDHADFCLCVPSNNTPAIQEAHVMVGHILCELIESALFVGE